MKFSAASLRNDKVPSEEEQPPIVDKFRVDSIVWAIAATLASIAWAISAYLMVREKQQAKVRLAHLEIERKRISIH